MTHKCTLKVTILGISYVYVCNKMLTCQICNIWLLCVLECPLIPRIRGEDPTIVRIPSWGQGSSSDGWHWWILDIVGPCAKALERLPSPTSQNWIQLIFLSIVFFLYCSSFYSKNNWFNCFSSFFVIFVMLCCSFLSFHQCLCRLPLLFF